MRTNERPKWKDISNRPRPVKTMLPDGTFYMEKRNQIPFSFKMVDPSGWVGWVPHANGATIRGFTDNPYGNFIRELKKQQGFLLYNTCPYVQGIPVQGDDKPCTGDRATGKAPTNSCCEHMTALIERRKKVQGERSAEYAKSFQTQSEKQLEITIKALQALADTGIQSGGGDDEPMFRKKK